MRLYLFLLLPFLLGATPLKVLIAHAKNSHLSLQAIKKRIVATEYAYKTTKNFSDPIISLGLSDIQFQEPTNRGLEPMQYSSVNIKQSIPFFGKRAAEGKRVLAQKDIDTMSLKQTTVKLVEGIKITAYEIWKQEHLLDITNRYIDLTKQDIRLYSAYSSSQSSSHIQMIAAKLFLSELQIKQSNLSAAISGLYKRLGYLSNMQVLHVKPAMNVSVPKPLSYYLHNMDSNKEYGLKQAVLKKADADIKIKKLAFYPNPFVQAGYYHRQRFRDYAGITVGFSLPIYGTQRLREEQSKATALSKQSDVLNFKNDLTSKIEQRYADLQDAYRVYEILSKQSMTQVRDMAQVSSSYIQSGTSLFVYIDTLKKQFVINEQKIIATALYKIYLADLDALIGNQN